MWFNRTREQRIESTIESVLSDIDNNYHEFTPEEQVIIILQVIQRWKAKKTVELQLTRDEATTIKESIEKLTL